MEEKALNEKESLELISQMIRNTQERFRKHNAIPFLVFGYTTLAVSIAIWYLFKETRSYWCNLLWLLIPVLGFGIMALIRKNQPHLARTFVDRTISYVWYVCGIAVFAVSFTPSIWKHTSIIFVVAYTMSIASTISGLISKMKIITICGGLSILLSLILPSIKGVDVVLYFGAIFIVMQIIPGHILFSKLNKNV